MLPRIDIEGTLQLPENGPAMLQTLFAEHRRVIVKKEFTGNLSGSRVFLVQPIAERGAEYPTVVKFAALSLIEKEWRAYQQVRQMLYGMVQARDSVLPTDGDWGALSYPLQGGGTFEIENLWDYYRNHSVHETLATFRRVFKTLESIHNQSRAAPGFFWRASYDQLLPVNLLIATGAPPLDALVHILDAADVGAQNVQPGDWVRLQGFAVTKVDLRDHTVTLNLPYQPEHPDSFCVRLKVTENPTAYREHQIAPLLEGRVTATRQSQLQTYIQSLLGNEAAGTTAPLISVDGVSFPNPFLSLAAILNQYRDVRTALIHGDLNLHNILVDVDTGHISLIDIAEAREDHILHDFLRMETEVVTKLLPDVLNANALPTAQTMFEFYQALHCATFELHTLHDHRVPSDLEKPFEAIRAIRQAALRHFYSDDPAEYYQGLLLYLVGSLKFGNLDHHPTAPLPKQAALWGAATVAWILESVPSCKPFSAPMPGIYPPVALLIDYTPEVKVLRKDTECFVPASRGIPLYQGDIVSTFTGAEALVYCQSGPLFTIPDERNQRIDDSHIPHERIRVRLEMYDTARWPYLVNHFSSNIALPSEATSPLLLTPRQTRLHNARPTFCWRAVAGATGYRLSLRMPGGITWQRETHLTRFPYPADAPALAPGSGNTVIVEALNTPFQPEIVYLEMLNNEELTTVQTQENIIRDLYLGEAAECYLLALLYHRWKLWDAAIRQLEQLTRVTQPLSSTLWLHLGELCLRVGLYPQSEEHYLQALTVAKADKDLPTQTIAHIGLACVANVQSHPSQAGEYLEIVTSGEYATVAQFLQRQLDVVSRTNYRKTPNLSSLFAYARFLAEQIAGHLSDEIRQIPDRFLEQLRTMSTYTLKPTAGAWSTLGSNKFAAPEMLAATYITTRTLVETFSRAEIEQQIQTGQLQHMLENHAHHIAQMTLGFPPAWAEDFARRYAVLVGNDPDVFQQLMEFKEP